MRAVYHIAFERSRVVIAVQPVFARQVPDDRLSVREVSTIFLPYRQLHHITPFAWVSARTRN